MTFVTPLEMQVFEDTEEALRQVCDAHRVDPAAIPLGKLTSALVRFTLTGEYNPDDCYNPLEDKDYQDEQVKQIVGTIADYLFDRCHDLDQIIRISRLWDLAGRNPEAA